MRARLVPLLVLPALALPAACGDDADPLELVSTAGAETVDESVAHLASTTELQAGGATVTVDSDGLVDFDGDRASLTTQLPAGAGEVDVVGDGTTLYIRGPGLDELGVTTPWAKFDLERVGDLTGTDLEQLRSSNEASSGLDLLAGAEDVEELGGAEVDGADTTHYRATVDVRKAVEEAGAVRDRDRFEAFVDRLGDEQLEVDVWLDSEDRVRRLRYEPPAADGQAASVRVTLEFSDFGSDERIEVPRPEEATDLTDQVLQQAQAATA